MGGEGGCTFEFRLEVFDNIVVVLGVAVAESYWEAWHLVDRVS